MYSTLEDSCILCSSQENLTAQSHSNLRSLNMVIICNKYLSEELTGPFNKELISNNKTWSTFCSTCFENSQTLTSLNEELESIKSKIQNHIKEMKRIITTNQINALRANKVKGECFITVDNIPSFSNSVEIPMSIQPGSNNISVEQSLSSVKSNFGSCIEKDKPRKSFELPFTVNRHNSVKAHLTATMKPAATVKPAEARKEEQGRVRPLILRSPRVKRVTPDQKNKYNCKKCGESFEKSSQLIMHSVNVHTKEKTFQCDICPLWFSSATKVKMHKHNAHTVSKYKCNFCDKYFEFYVNLEHHLEKHIEINPKIINVPYLPQENNTIDVNTSPLYKTSKRSSTVTSSHSNDNNKYLLGMESCYQDEETGDNMEIEIKPNVKIEVWSPTMVANTEESD